MKPPQKLYRFHIENLRAIETALGKIALILRDAIAKNDKKTINSFVRLYSLLLAAWAECRLQKVIYEPGGFSAEERSLIQANSQQIAKWQTTIDIAFRKYYNIASAPLSIKTLPHSSWSRYATLSEMLEIDLKALIELRNKLAHGQWVYPLNEDANDVAQAQMNLLRNENLMSLQFRKALITSLADMIHDLVVSPLTFERDFDRHFSHIVTTRQNLHVRDYELYAKILRDKLKRGKAKKQENI
jgi:hypothetical protein